MNKTKYMQTDSRWGGLGYPKKPWYLRNCGCGEVSICNVIIEMEQYKKYTPKTIQPYCKQFAAPNGDGTYWSGIPKMMRHYGLTEVKEHATMDKLWKELKKGGRVAIYLMGSRRGGSKKVHWTSSGHFVCSVGYKYEKGDHWVYMKDSYSNSSLRNGWISYEGNMKYDVLKVWSGKLNSKAPAPKPTPAPTPAPAPKPTEKTLIQKEMDACRAQADWMKNYKYKWVPNPTIANSKKFGTCVTYVAVVLQRLGILKSGQYIWIDEKGKVFGTNNKMTVTYLKGTLASNRDKLKKGDIVIGGNGNVHAASGSHIFVITGQWKGDNPVIFDQASADRVRKGQKPGHQWKGSFRTIARIRLKG